jgi:hypothetical protein
MTTAGQRKLKLSRNAGKMLTVLGEWAVLMRAVKTSAEL